MGLMLYFLAIEGLLEGLEVDYTTLGSRLAVGGAEMEESKRWKEPRLVEMLDRFDQELVSLGEMLESSRLQPSL